MRRLISAGLALSAMTLSLVATNAAQAQVFTESFVNTTPSVPNTLAGSSTAYSLVAAGANSAPGQYRVIANPSTAFTNGYTNFNDHTVGTAAGAMMFFDGSSVAGTTLFSSGVRTLTVGSTYNFSFWGASAFTSNFPTLQASLNGVAFAPVLTTTNGVFNQYTATFTAVTALNTLTIANTNTSTAPGNDGAIDDVQLSLASAAPEPGSALLLIPGLMGLVGVVRRRARK